jgi:Fe-S cluster biogenesis protein NfuA
MDTARLEHALAEFRPFLESDGGDICLEQVDEATGTATLRLVIGKSACTNCIVEPQMLHEIVTEFLLGKAIAGLRAIEVIDPRLAAEVAR